MISSRASVKESLRQVLSQKAGKLGLTSRAPYAQYQGRPVDFIREVLGQEPWEKQQTIAKDLDEKHFVTVASCNGAGKTIIAAWMALYFMNCFQNCTCVLMAPGHIQVKKFWRNMREAFWTSRLPLGGEMQTEKYEFDSMWYTYGIASDKEERYQGDHAPPGGILVVIMDEASGVKPFVFNAVQGYLTSKNSYVFLIGNPNNSEGGFYDSFNKTGDKWVKHTITAFEVPEEINGNPVMDKSWIEECRRIWGEDSPQWEVRVLGRFPKTGGDYQLIPRWVLEYAKDAVPDTHHFNVIGKHVGVDLSRGANDNNVMCLTDNGILAGTHTWTSRDAMQTAERIVTLAKDWGVPDGNLHMEADGVGGPIIDRVRQLGMTVDEVRSAGPAMYDWRDITGNTTFSSRKAELAFVGSLALKHDPPLQSIPELPEYAQYWKELQRINYDDGMDKEKTHGKVKMEDKRKLVQRTGVSPDHADAWFLSLSRMGSGTRVWFI